MMIYPPDMPRRTGHCMVAINACGRRILFIYNQVTKKGTSLKGSIINYCDKMSIESDYFMRMDSSPYKGEWIAIHGESVVAHSKSLKEVHKQACAQYNMSSLLFVPVLGDETYLL